MNALLLIVAAQATTIADICTVPAVDPKSPAPYCVVETPLRIETEYYAITIEPPQIVLFQDEGRFLEVMPAARQSPVTIGIGVDRQTEEEVLSALAFHNCPDAVLEAGKFLRCERNDEGYVSRIYAARVGTHLVVVGYSRSPRVESSPGEEEEYERMLSSIELPSE